MGRRACLVAVAVLAHAVVDGQVVNERFDDAYLGLTARVDVPTLVYAQSDGLVPVVYAGEPVFMNVELSNLTGSDIQVGSGDDSWMRRLSFVFKEMSTTSGREPAGMPRVAEIAAGAGTPSKMLPRGRTSRSRYRLEDGTETLPPGQYSLVVSLDEAVLGPAIKKLNNRLFQNVAFEVRVAEGRLDLLDYHLHRTARAIGDGRLSEAREWAERVLQMNATSLPATSQIATIAAQMGDCEAAARHVEQATRIVEDRADTDLHPTFWFEVDPALLQQRIGRLCDATGDRNG